MMSQANPPVVDELVARSNQLGSDPQNTNYGGGNTSAKGAVPDPVSGSPVDVLWVKGSGGDLGTLTADGLATLLLDRVRALAAAYRGEQHEDEMHDLLDQCAFRPGGPAPSIDTAMHALVGVPHVDHLHPDAVIALAAAADGKLLVKECYGDEVAWLDWRRPGWELGVDIARRQRADPGLKGVVLGGHGLTAWGQTSEECQRNTLELIGRAAAFLHERTQSDPLGAVRTGFGPLPPGERRDRAAVLAPVIRGLAAHDRPVIGHYVDDDLVLDFISREATPRVVPLGTSCPDHFLRTKIRPLLLDLPAQSSVEDQVARLRQLHTDYRAEYRSYYERYADEATPAMRGADPAIFLIPGVGMFSFGADAKTARVAGEFYLNAINVIRGAEAVSTYQPVHESEKFRVEYWALEDQKLQRLPKPKPLTGKVALVTGSGSGIGRAIAGRLRDEGAVVAVGDIDLTSARAVVDELGSEDHALAVAMDVTDEASVRAAVEATVLRFGGLDIVVNNAGLSISKSLFETSIEDWERQHAVMSRGSFLVSQQAATALRAQGRGGAIVYVVSKNAVVAGPDNVAYGTAKAGQAHQVRLLAAELGQYGIRVNGVNPDAVVQGSGIFAGGWGAERAKLYGVDEDELGKFYASRTLLKQEVLPEHVADAVFCLVSDNLSRTTGTIIPVDGGLPAAFLR